MSIRVKSFQKVVQVSSMLDGVFESQGFKKTKGKDYPYYRLKLSDLSTRTKYEIQIPIQEIFYRDREPLYKINEMTIHLVSPSSKRFYIPEAVVDAAKEKLNETLSYLAVRK